MRTGGLFSALSGVATRHVPALELVPERLNKSSLRSALTATTRPGPRVRLAMARSGLWSDGLWSTVLRSDHFQSDRPLLSEAAAKAEAGQGCQEERDRGRLGHLVE